MNPIRFVSAKKCCFHFRTSLLHTEELLTINKINFSHFSLGGRFPETLNAKDKHGRTPLHYAATIPDNGHYFNVLLNLGADRKMKDNVSNNLTKINQH